MKKIATIVASVLLVSLLFIPTFADPVATNEIMIQAEDFTNSYDTSVGNGDLVYRLDTDTDIGNCHDHFLYNGYRIDMESGEWVEYNFDVPATDTWAITFRGGYLNFNFDLYFDGNLYQHVDGIETDLLTDYADTVVTGVNLTQGPHTMKLLFTSGTTFGGNRLDYIRFTSQTNPPAPLIPPTKPYSDVPPVAPTGFVKFVDQNGLIQADGPNLRFEKTGEVAQLRGYALHGPTFFPTIPNNTLYNLVYSLGTTTTKNGLNVIRIPMYIDYGGYLQGSQAQKEWTDRKVLEIIHEAVDTGVYVVISWHYHGNPLDYTTQAVEYFSWLSSEVGQYDNVIYEIINEPDGGTSWSKVKTYADQVIPAIRANDPDNLIIVGTPFWCQNVDDALAAPLNDTNVAYTFHFYTAVHNPALWTRIDNVKNAGLPVFVSEWSPGHYDWTIGQYNFAVADDFIEFMEQRGIPWIDWQFSTKGEILSALHWNNQYYGPWNTSDFTAGGLYINDKLDNPRADETSPVAPAGFVATTISAGKIQLDWSDNSETDLQRYKVYRNTIHGFVPSKTTYIGKASASEYLDTQLTPSTQYYYLVTAVDTYGNEGPTSIEVSATTSAVDTIPPIAPVSLTATTVSKSQIKLDWSDNPEPDLKNYKVYRSDTTGFTADVTTFVIEVSASEYLDSGLLDDKVYYYVVSAVDESANEGVVSAEVNARTLTLVDDGIIDNGSFSRGLESWNFAVQPGTPANAVAGVSNGELKVDIASAGTSDWHIQLRQNNVPGKQIVFEGNKTYKGGFEARSSSPTNLFVGVGMLGGSWVGYGGNWYQVDGTMKNYEFDAYYTETDPNARFDINLGIVSPTPNTVWVDNVYLRFDDGIVQNGDFSQGTDSWGTFAYGGEGASAVYNIDNGALHADIATGGTSGTWNIQVRQQGLQIEKGEFYEVAFDAWADRERPLEVGVGRFGTAANGWDYTTYGSENFNINTQKQRYVFTFKMKEPTDTVSRLDFNIGLLDLSDVWIDDVSIRKIEGDHEPPAAPVGLVANASSYNKISLDWADNTEEDFAFYKVYRGGVFVGEATDSSFSDTGLSQATTYCYKVTAVDINDNEGDPGTEVCATTEKTIKVQYRVPIFNVNDSIRVIRFRTQIVNDGDDKLALTDVKARYWFTSEYSLSDMVASCNYAAVGKENVVLTFGRENDNDYVDIGFTQNAKLPILLGGRGIVVNELPAGKSTGEVFVTIKHKGCVLKGCFDDEESSFLKCLGSRIKQCPLQDQTNDYSYDPTKKSLQPKDHEKMTGYLDDDLVWGIPAPDITAPVAPTGLVATTISTIKIGLDWNDNTEADLTKYVVYRSETQSGPYNLVGESTQSSYSDDTLLPAATYYYVVTAVDDNENESPYSNEAGETTLSFDGGLIQNGDFADGWNHWISWGNYMGYASVFEIVDNTFHTKVETAGGPGMDWAVQQKQNGLPLEGNHAYKLTFDAWSNTARTIKVRLGEDGGDYSTYGEATLGLTTQHQNYELVVEMSQSDLASTLDFNMAGDVGDVWIDNVRIVEVFYDGMITNGDFGLGLSNWQGGDYMGHASSFGVVDGVFHTKVESLTDPVYDWAVQLKQPGLALVSGRTYELSFDAWSDRSRGLYARLGENGGDYSTYGQTTVALSTAPTRYTLIVEMGDQSDLAATVDFNLAAEVGDVWIDNVSLVELVFDGGVITNGDFLDGMNGWGTYVHVPANGGTAVAGFSIDSGDLHALITNPGDAEWNVKMSQGLALQNYTTYEVRFQARSNQPKKIKAVILDSVYNWFGEIAPVLTQDMEEYSFTFNTANRVNTPIDLSFNLGFITAGNENGDVWIDKVSVKPIS